ncbi:MAG: helix-turn-helix transcriptional regulator [Myxococcota bacterium]
MTRPGSAALRQILTSAVAAYGETDVGSSKEELLTFLLERGGPTAILASGLHDRSTREHPVARALARSTSPAELLRRWGRLEKFGHAKNRTRLLDASGTAIRIEHFSLDETPAHPLNDLFIWGVLLGLLRHAGHEPARAWVGEVLIYEGELQPVDEMPAQTSTLRLVGFQTPATREPASPDAQTLAGRLEQLVRTDLLAEWRVERASRALGLSARSLQRRLRSEGTTFSSELQRTRVAVAREMLLDRRLSLSEIAFCTGFSDLAHFSRIGRRFLDVPPSAFRDLLK